MAESEEREDTGVELGLSAEAKGAWSVPETAAEASDPEEE